MRNITASAVLFASFFVAIPSSQAALVYGSNVIINGDAEANSGNYSAPSDWTNSGDLVAIKYGTVDATGAFPTSSEGAPNGGNYFFGGAVATSPVWITQSLDVSYNHSAIDAHLVNFSLTGYLGGYSVQDDNAVFSVSFFDASNTLISSATIGPVTAGDRNNVTEFLLRGTGGLIPEGTRILLFTLTSTRSQGTYNDGYADNLSFVATCSNNDCAVTATPLPAALPLFATGVGVLGLFGWRRKRKAQATA